MNIDFGGTGKIAMMTDANTTIATGSPLSDEPLPRPTPPCGLGRRPRRKRGCSSPGTGGGAGMTMTMLGSGL